MARVSSICAAMSFLSCCSATTGLWCIYMAWPTCSSAYRLVPWIDGRRIIKSHTNLLPALHLLPFNVCLARIRACTHLKFSFKKNKCLKNYRVFLRCLSLSLSLSQQPCKHAWRMHTGMMAQFDGWSQLVADKEIQRVQVKMRGKRLRMMSGSG